VGPHPQQATVVDSLRSVPGLGHVQWDKAGMSEVQLPPAGLTPVSQAQDSLVRHTITVDTVPVSLWPGYYYLFSDGHCHPIINCEGRPRVGFVLWEVHEWDSFCGNSLKSTTRIQHSGPLREGTELLVLQVCCSCSHPVLSLVPTAQGPHPSFVRF